MLADREEASAAAPQFAPTDIAEILASYARMHNIDPQVVLSAAGISGVPATPLTVSSGSQEVEKATLIHSWSQPQLKADDLDILSAELGGTTTPKGEEQEEEGAELGGTTTPTMGGWGSGCTYEEPEEEEEEEKMEEKDEHPARHPKDNARYNVGCRLTYIRI